MYSHLSHIVVMNNYIRANTTFLPLYVALQDHPYRHRRHHHHHYHHRHQRRHHHEAMNRFLYSCI